MRVIEVARETFGDHPFTAMQLYEACQLADLPVTVQFAARNGSPGVTMGKFLKANPEYVEAVGSRRHSILWRVKS